ncbi:MAG TPA: peptidyl-alpha-hydroxyglycine alpha-amidating lyase family protein [Thermoanaerobaculia bacterium]|nr:peptidyl-alpha-hydroxyglycine alpha-amidating lyase family protein [Thermoanaerobaculia bacterium]
MRAVALWIAVLIAATGRYHVVHDWPVVPEGEIMGWVVSGVGTDSRGDVFVFHRAGREWPASDELDLTPIARPTILRFDGRTGALKAAWGVNQFAMPHGLTVDAGDNVWVTDVALQQVFKFSHDGRLLLTIGERGVRGADGSHFDRPTKVAVARDGAFYVSDGNRNNRVVKFAPDGRFLMQWGSKGSGPGEFDLPHGIALDDRGRVYVADRGNARVEIFESEGRYAGEWKGPQFGRPFDIAFRADGVAFIADGGDIPSQPPDRSRVIAVARDRHVIGQFGKFGVYDGQFYRAHDLAVSHDGSVYVGDANGRVQKFVTTIH